MPVIVIQIEEDLYNCKKHTHIKKKKSKALSKCKDDYENSDNYGYGYCEIK
jgi:hypothetical protein